MKVFLTIFYSRREDPEPEPFLELTDPALEGPKNSNPTDPDPQHCQEGISCSEQLEFSLKIWTFTEAYEELH